MKRFHQNILSATVAVVAVFLIASAINNNKVSKKNKTSDCGCGN